MTITRTLKDSKYANLSENFYIKEKKFTIQYAPLYAERLVSMRNEVKKAAQNKWGDKYEIKNLVELETDKKCVIIGTLYKEMKFKPGILKEMAEDENNGIPIQPVLSREAKYIDNETDQLILEDEVQRILLIDADGKSLIKDNNLCTGLVIALLGHENEQSKFEVEDYCFKETPMTLLKPAKNTRLNIDSKYILFISGIELGDPKTNDNLYRFQLFIDYVCGDFIGNADTEKENNLKKKLSNSMRLVIAGNSLSSATQSKDMHNKAKYLTKNFKAGSVCAIKQLDDFLVQLSSKIEVDLMPGEFDPSNLMLPQQPLHHSMFLKSKSINGSTFHTTTNPYQFSIDDTCFLGTSGQFIEDIRRSTSLTDPIDMMKLTLESGHLGPTCPDTLACYPFYGKDPFIVDYLPHVYFCGNQSEFKHDFYHDKISNSRVELLSLPKFCSSNSCILFDLNTFKSEEILF